MIDLVLDCFFVLFFSACCLGVVIFVITGLIYWVYWLNRRIRRWR